MLRLHCWMPKPAVMEKQGAERASAAVAVAARWRLDAARLALGLPLVDAETNLVLHKIVASGMPTGRSYLQSDQRAYRMSNDNSRPPETSPAPSLPQFMAECAVVFYALQHGENLLGRAPEELLGDVGLDALLHLARAVESSNAILDAVEQRLVAVQAAVWSTLQAAVPPPGDG